LAAARAVEKRKLAKLAKKQTDNSKAEKEEENVAVKTAIRINKSLEREALQQEKIASETKAKAEHQMSIEEKKQRAKEN
jgi:hypothetical protein